MIFQCQTAVEKQRDPAGRAGATFYLVMARSVSLGAALLAAIGSLSAEEPAAPDHVNDTVDGKQHIAEHNRRAEINNMFADIALSEILHQVTFVLPGALAMRNINDRFYEYFSLRS